MSNVYQVRSCNENTGVSTFLTLTRNWTRYTPPNPYTNSIFSKDEFNMRRKAEVLQHRNQGIHDSSQTLNAQFARLVNGKRFTNRARNAVCENIPKPSSASNVPGKRNLFFNSVVPLTRFNPPLRTYQAS